MENDIILSIVMATLLFLLMVSFIIAFWMLHRKKGIAHLLEKQQLRSAYEQELLRSQLEIREQTLKNISQEIHDNIGQVLSLVKLNISTMQQEDAQGLSIRIADSKALLGKAIQDLRDLSRSMDTDTIAEKGWYAALENELDILKKTGVYEVSLHTNGGVCRMEATHELILFRIFQEILNNIIKHANATAIRVSIQYNEITCVLRVEDNGHGFDAEGMLPDNNIGGGMGLRNMYKRSALIGADFQVHSSIPNGTVVQISFPHS